MSRTADSDSLFAVSLDYLLRVSIDEARAAVESAAPTAHLSGALLAPVESQEVWAELLAAARVFNGQLTATIHGSADDPEVPALMDILTERVGRVVWNGWPTGVSVSYAQHHGGPYPTTTSVRTISVGTAAIDRFLRPVTYQDAPADVLPPALRENNPWRLPRRVDGMLQLA